MGILGFASGGSSGLGQSRLFRALPWKGWREVANWVEEMADAIGFPLDVLNNRFISASARANLLDPTVTPSDIATTYLATATAAPTGAASADSMLDVLLYIALGIDRADSNLSVAQKQSLAQIGWDALKRKGTRLQMLRLASALSGGVAQGWTVPPNNFSVILPDGAPSAGWGNWVQSSSSLDEVIRPWILAASRQMLNASTPAWGNLGVGFSQWRAGYSSAGETVFPSGARINILANEHFSSWTGATPDSWTASGTQTQSSSASGINWEFTGYALQWNATAAASGSTFRLTQAGTCNNQVNHVLEVDYAYSNPQSAAVLQLLIYDAQGNIYQPSTGTWSATASYSSVLPVSSSRTRYSLTFSPHALTSSMIGQSQINVRLQLVSDGTSTTQQTYTFYRVGLYEQFSATVESAAQGERTAWWPLHDALGWTTFSRTAGGTLIEPANYNRSAYKVAGSATDPVFPYHPALSGRGFRACSTWTNTLKGSNDFNTDWTKTNCTATLNSAISPILGETVATATKITASGAGATSVAQLTGTTPTSKTFVGGVWVKLVAGTPTACALSMSSTSTTKSVSFTPTTSWQLVPLGSAVFGVADVAALTFKVSFTASSGTDAIALASAYAYDVTGKTGVLYPPIVQTPIGSTASINPTKLQATTATLNTNVLHPLLQRAMLSTAQGLVTFVVVPTFDASSQPNAVLFDIAQTATTNRVVLDVNAGTLRLRTFDSASRTGTATLTLTAGSTPASGSMTWLRDTAITIRCRWSADGSLSLSAGNGNASSSAVASFTSVDGSQVAIGLGNDYALANPFDGVVRDFEPVQIGAPVS